MSHSDTEWRRQIDHSLAELVQLLGAVERPLETLEMTLSRVRRTLGGHEELATGAEADGGPRRPRRRQGR